ncbi:hypothetical protein SAMN02745866_03604 [Alteromonadaceae bacterium Bs31]|nr:hypothetical protein SAMN02745866_03604 [Alteromonadaceae bacterium Bs31]
MKRFLNLRWNVFIRSITASEAKAKGNDKHKQLGQWSKCVWQLDKEA